MNERALIENHLEDLARLDEIRACMVTGRNLEGISPSNNEIDDIDLWKLITETIDNIFPVIREFYDYDLTNLYFEIRELEINIALLKRNIALIAIYPKAANKGLIEIEVENTRRKLLDSFEEDGI